MAATARTHLMFQDGSAAEAAEWYVSLVPGSRIVDASGPVVMFELAGTTFSAFDSPVEHGFDFTPSSSIFVTFDTADELDAAWAQLVDGGTVRMPLDAYDFAPRFGWVDDRHGVSWQLSLA